MKPGICLLMITLPFLSGVSFAYDSAFSEEIGRVEVLQSEADALRAIFPSGDSVVSGVIVVDSSLASTLRRRLGRTVNDSVFMYFEVYERACRIGTAVVSEEQGKYRPITFMAGADTLIRIVDARVLVYRESRGGEVGRARFLKQYRGKSLDDPTRINRDIINITGATISVNALNAGVRKALAVVEHLHPPGKTGK